jgi:surface protein
MRQMFADCKKFNSDISKWNIDKKCNVDKMFRRYPDREKIIKTTPEIIHDSNKPKGSNDGFIWYRMWKYLNENGATKKRKVISDLQLKTYSYASLIDELDSSNIIILKPNDDLVAIPQNEWCKPIF